jgi:putative hemolysin
MFKVSIVSGGKLLEKAQVLRYKVFFSGKGKDQDRFDRFCRHLVAVDKKTGKAVGTYRLLLGSVASESLGFYSESEFDLKKIKQNCKGELLEMGRACVDSAYRRYPVIKLMWGELLAYFKENKVKYVFGCASIPNPSPRNIGILLGFFKKKCFAPAQFRARPLKHKKYPYIKASGKIKEREVLRSLPSLVKGYLKMGAYVSSEPVWDKEFNTADFFMLLDTARLNRSFKKRFL